MATADNEKRTDERLRVGLLAPTSECPPLVAAIRAVSEIEFCAQAGMRQSEAAPDVPWFDDTRVMLAQGGVELLVLGVSPREAPALVGDALEHGVHVWRPPPLGRTFAEATAAAPLARRNRPVYRAASWWDAAARPVREVLEAAGGALRATYCDLCVTAPGPAGASWHSSCTESGGGVLVNEAYDLLDGLIALRGLPETVSAAIGAFRQRPGMPVRDGEDTVAAILRYDDGGVANLRCGWELAPTERFAAYHDHDWSLWLRDDRATMRRTGGSIAKEAALPSDFLAADLTRTVAAIRDSDRAGDGVATLDRQVAVAALIDTIYLAARTHQPEAPRKLYEVQGWPLPERR